VLVTGLALPEGIAVSDGALLVVETGARRLSRIDLESRTSTPLARDLAVHVESQGDFPPTMIFNGVATDGTYAYVTGDRENVLYRIRL
jgi:sugar lactone lactonase YvrE